MTQHVNAKTFFLTLWKNSLGCLLLVLITMKYLNVLKSLVSDKHTSLFVWNAYEEEENSFVKLPPCSIKFLRPL
jgi:hypothetical protein